MSLRSARADRLTAVILFVLGAGLGWAGWSMDRLEIRRIHPASFPGLLPMILGGALAALAVLLYVGAREPEGADEAGSNRDLLIAGALCAAYALLLVGTVDFEIATAVFVAAFVAAFDRNRALVPRLGLAAAFGAAVAVAVSVLFRDAFLVRLP